MSTGGRWGAVREWGYQMTEWLTLEEAAAHIKVARRTLGAWVRQGKVKGYLLSGTIRHVYRFRREDLDAMLAPSSAVPAEREAAC